MPSAIGPPSRRCRSTGRFSRKLSRDIRIGKFQPGQNLPSEAALVQQFGTSRITIGRALRELKERGLVERVAGSGTFVPARQRAPAMALLFGLLIPDLGETEIFEPICQGIAGAPQTSRTRCCGVTTDPRALREAAGSAPVPSVHRTQSIGSVFRAARDGRRLTTKSNLTISRAAGKGAHPDRAAGPLLSAFPERSRHDLVGIDNRRAAYLATEHLLKAGVRARRIPGLVGAAPTVDARIAGYREALLAHDAALRRGTGAAPGSLTALTMSGG